MPSECNRLKHLKELPEDELSKHGGELVEMALEDGHNAVRWSVWKRLQVLPGDELSKYGEQIVKVAMEDDCWRVRWSASICLTKLPHSELSRHGEKIVKVVSKDGDSRVRWLACTCLIKLPDFELSKYGGKLVKVVSEDGDKDVRRSACKCLTKLPAAELSKYGEQLLKAALEDGDASVRRSAFRCLQLLPAAELSKYAEQFVKVACEDGDSGFRRSACACLFKLQADELSKHGEEIMKVASEDGYQDLSMLAFECLSKLPSDELSKYGERIMKVASEHGDADVRLLACRFLFRLPAGERCKYGEQLVKVALEDGDQRLRRSACECLLMFPPDALSRYSVQLVKMVLEDDDTDVCWSAWGCLQLLSGDELSKYGEQLVKVASEGGDKVMRKSACKCLIKLPVAELSRYGEQLLKVALEDGDASVRLSAFRCLQLLPAAELSKYGEKLDELSKYGQRFGEVASKNGDWTIRSEAEEIMKVAVEHGDEQACQRLLKLRCASIDEILCKCAEQILQERSSWELIEAQRAMRIFPPTAWQKLPEAMSTYTFGDDKKTWLHLAAEVNNLEACRALLDGAGVPARPRDSAGREPYQLATCPEVDTFLRGRVHIADSRFASGHATQQAEADKECVSQIDWVMQPLEGGRVARFFSVKHSYLIITCGEKGASRYVLRKVQPWDNSQDGTIVSFFTGVDASSVSNAEVVRSNKEHVREGLTMAYLIGVCRSIGPYKRSNRNCHDAAREVYNACCSEKSLEVGVFSQPNFFASRVFMGGGEGVLNACAPQRVTNAVLGPAPMSRVEVPASGLRMVSEIAPSGSLQHSAQVSIPPGFNVKSKRADRRYGLEAAILSAVVYDDDWINDSVRLAQSRGDRICVHNSFNDTVVLVQASKDGAKKTELPSGTCSEIPVDHQRVEWDIYPPTRVPFCTPPKLASKVPAYRGCSYQIVSENRTAVHLRQVDAMAGFQFVVKHSAIKARDRTPLQWMLAQDNASKVFYIVFRGTVDSDDAFVDLNCSQDFGTSHWVGMHTGIKNTLLDPDYNVMDEICRELQKYRRSEEDIVLCGHSLGGGYAQAAACYLVSDGWKVTAVRTFGSLHPLAPHPEHEHCMEKAAKSRQMLEKLAQVMQHYIHAWDPVPRLPWCRKWVREVLADIKAHYDGGTVCVGVKLSQVVAELAKTVQWERLERYDIIGEIVMLGQGPSAYVRGEGESEGEPAQARSSLKELLAQVPPSDIDTKQLVPYHKMIDYCSILQRLAQV